MENLLKGSLELNKMFAALQRTATGLRRDFGEVENLQQSLRGSRDFVAKASARIEEMILSDLMLVRPAAGILTPNLSRDGDGRDEFVLALSGAANFVRANDNFAISLALRSNGQTKIALVYSPIDEKLYYAEGSDGGTIAFTAYHSSRVAVSEIDAAADMMIATDFATHGTLKSIPQKNWRMTGCPAMDLAGVAAGKIDLAVFDAMDFSETAAGQMLVESAGGHVWESNGEIFAANARVYKSLTTNY
ncbi:MAG: hypothetical protein LBR41_01555 [Rickettsiales bacterium]|jgi:myo-inositol-1(or 4)-monophosphatase|nr:hypothetical protein [Rickettsiales bacterium]